jgi:hypothetical protein
VKVWRSEGFYVAAGSTVDPVAAIAMLIPVHRPCQYAQGMVRLRLSNR